MSIRALVGLVTLILGGVAWSVRWYLDGAEALAAAPRAEQVAAAPCAPAPCSASDVFVELVPERAPEALTWREAQHAGWSHCDVRTRKGERSFGGDGFDASKLYWDGGAATPRFPADATDERPAKREPPS